ncbi:helix-turn-helix domain-containing protein [Hymenobacter terricola]|uniref:helix-turn-helix domain-containing protein n=1 Tax=Hymenobacter terricola TaxID=2819236 RepID=UPI001B302433|nr:helix-turn-helix domain-containing protein [Hymenobacter terricola]
MLLNIPSAEDFQALQQKLDAVLAHLVAAAKPAADEFMSLQEVATYTQFDPRTVEKWVNEGDFSKAGKRIYLQAHRYSGRLRFKRTDVEAFGLGVGVLTPSLGAGLPEAIKSASTGKATKKSRATTSEQALRKVA